MFVFSSPKCILVLFVQILKPLVFLFLFGILFCRKERKERSEKDKERSKRPREDASEEERSRYSSSRPKVSGSQRSGFRHDPPDRWGSSVSRERIPVEHRRDRFEYQRAPGYHRDRERDHFRQDKRYLCLYLMI